MKKNGMIHYIITLVATLFALGLIVLYTFGSFYKAAKEDAITIGETKVKERTEKLNNFFLQSVEVINITEHMVNYMLEHGHNAEEIEEFLAATSKDFSTRINENFTGIYGWIDETYVDGVGWVPDAGYFSPERIWYTEAVKAGGEAVIVPPYVDAQTNEVIVSLAEMLPNGKDVISLDIILKRIQNIAEEINMNGNGYGYVLDRDGMIVAHSDKKERGKNYLKDEELQHTATGVVIKKIMQGEECHFETEIDGEKAKQWIANGAQPTDTVKALLKKNGVL